MNIQKRDIVVAIILSFVTCGIYGIYWFVKMTDETNALSNQQEATSGGVAFLLTLITCNIYGYYWAYKQGEKISAIKAARGETDSNLPVLYLILQICGLAIVNYCLMQNEINKAVA